MQAYRKDFPVPEPVEGPLSKPHIYTVAYASGSESSVLFSWLMLLLILPSVFFRVIPWLMLLLILGLISVAYSASASFHGSV